MRFVFFSSLFAVLASIASSATAQEAQEEGLSPALETCIRDNVDGVERAVDSLNDATEFLVSKLCADAVAAEGRRVQEARFAAMRSQLQQRCEAQQATASAGRERSDDEEDPCQMAEFYDPSSVSRIFVSYANASPTPPEATALAARLLLERRLSRRR